MLQHAQSIDVMAYYYYFSLDLLPCYRHGRLEGGSHLILKQHIPNMACHGLWCGIIASSVPPLPHTLRTPLRYESIFAFVSRDYESINRPLRS